MIIGKIIYLKDKQAFKKEGGVLKLMGKPIGIAKKAKEHGIKLIHIIDLDAQSGLKTNFDIYDKLTCLVNIEVEGVTDEQFIGRLLCINARVVIELPTKIDLGKWEDKKRLLVGRPLATTTLNDMSGVYDVIVEPFDEKQFEIAKKAKKRIIAYKNDLDKVKNKKAVFAVLEE